jgi:glycosyltransferase involved in cell wall biosynthesis
MLQRMDTILRGRKPSLCFYDHVIHFIGGGQKYGATMIEALKDRFDITILCHRPLTHDQLETWYGFDLRDCPIEVMPLPFFDEENRHIDPALVTARVHNPFHAVSLRSADFDFFVNNSMNEMVLPLSPVSLAICHFPERRPSDYFYMDRYTGIIFNSLYTAGWIRQRWGINPHAHLYPPVHMAPQSLPEKKPLILSVARFELGGSKKQLEMVSAFAELHRLLPPGHPWKLVLCGGSPAENAYLQKVRDAAEGLPVEIQTNIDEEALKKLYREASIFWHICGLGQRDPSLVEHFGMTIVEAMQNRLVPIVFDGGGQREIVDQGENGFRITRPADLLRHTWTLIHDENRRKDLAEGAYEKSKRFDKPRFIAETRALFDRLSQEYLTTT